MCIFIVHSWHVETVCLLSKLHSDQHIEVELNMDLDIDNLPDTEKRISMENKEDKIKKSRK